MESEEVLKQVEALFSAIDSLPDVLRGEALKKIQTRLGPTHIKNKKNAKAVKGKVKSKDEVSVDQADDSGRDEEELIKLCESDGIRILHCYSEAPEAGETSGIADEQHSQTAIKKSRFKKFLIKQSASKKNDICDDLQSKIVLADIREAKYGEQSKKSSGRKSSVTHVMRSKRKRRIPRRFLDGEEVEVGLQSGSKELSESVADEEIEGGDGEDCEQKEESPLVNVYKVPTGVKPNDIIQNVSETKDPHDRRRVRGQRTVYGCTVCSRKFHSRSMVLVHMRVHTGEKPHKCHICDKSFTQRGALNIHIKRHEGKFSFSCEYCSYKTIAKVDMVRHVARHTGEKNYSCEYCGKGYFTDSALKDHLRHVHDRSSTYTCQMCAFITHRPDNLKRHMIVKHSNKEYLQCPVCHEFIKQRGTFITHLRTHTGERPHSCPTCRKTFKSRSQVAAHVRIHKQGMFQCGECQRRFKTRFHLKRHSLVHTGEKPFNCMYCEYSCNVKGNINKHVRLVHGVKDFSFRTINGPKPKEAAKLGMEETEAKEIQDKGKAIAEEFLTKLSTRKDENLTVEDLKKVMELKKSEASKQQTEVVKVRRKKSAGEMNRVKARGKKAKMKKNMGLYEDEEVAAMTFLKDFQIEVNGEVECEDPELRLEDNEDQEFGEGTLTVVMDEEDEDGDSKIDGTTIILPPNGFICVQQPGGDGEGITLPVPLLTEQMQGDDCDDQLPPTTVYLIHCDQQS